jgi:hypothetical protein
MGKDPSLVAAAALARPARGEKLKDESILDGPKGGCAGESAYRIGPGTRTQALEIIERDLGEAVRGLLRARSTSPRANC